MGDKGKFATREEKGASNYILTPLPSSLVWNTKYAYYRRSVYAAAILLGVERFNRPLEH